jgi:hypothetical protein
MWALDDTNMNKPHPLPIPPDATSAGEAVEILRGWIIDGALQVCIAHAALGDRPDVWGQLLAEAVTHVADALSKDSNIDRERALGIVRESLLLHLESPSPDLSGEVQTPVQ